MSIKMENNKHLQKFGGSWTEEKLNMFTEYLDAYLIALQNMKFKKLYIDAFAGTGEIETRDGDHQLIGSAKRALSSKKQFDRYCFIEADKDKVEELQRMVDREFPSLKSIVNVYQGDANEMLINIINSVDWRYNRALLFLDPFATSVDWSTLVNVALTKSIDVWYLFPFEALNRMLPRDGEILPAVEKTINRILGDESWKTEFYKKDMQMNLFDYFNGDKSERFIKSADTEAIKEYIIMRLKSIFPCVSENAKIFRNSKNAPMFLFCFAVSNDSIKAQKLAMHIANHILKKSRK